MLSFARRHGAGYLFIVPFFALFLVFQLFPILWTFYISTQEWSGLGEPESVGLKNFRLLLTDPQFWDATANTLIYWVCGLVFILPLAMGISLLLNKRDLHGLRTFKTLTFLPYVCATVAIGLIFNIMFDTQQGLVNEVLGLVGLDQVGWLTTTTWSKVPVIVLNVWRHTPWFALILLGGLLNIPRDYYEAAKVDGAGAARTFWHITLPSLRPVLMFCMIMITVESWNIFAEPFIMRGPGTSNVSLFQYMYESSFRLFKYGYGAAIGVALTLILALVSIIQLFLMRKDADA
ncbi:sugar ABC transporter permease [Tessaracoccus aquimaris]|uniref:Sugar ABC transporter permease n=1 Tax=Tessaracoccus aquimaris TaxID=1332264 RepID=A0A1Q2CMR5_9ACTN|nr:sugar ABC transporter permease [Tessaracoccus aquimaris]AQP47386.1 sugar ABC transporter permease [Tessaracoccus aquimaris]